MKFSMSIGEVKVLREASAQEMNILSQRLWKIIKKNKETSKRKKILIKDKYFWISPFVFNPKNGEISLVLLEHLKVREDDKVLDIGTGCGIYGIFAIYRGAAKAVLTDISPYSVSCSRHNIKFHKMWDKAEVRRGSVFNPIKKGERFDLIITNPPFFREVGKIRSYSYLERCFIDRKGGFLYPFLKNAREHLTENGRIFMAYGKSGFVQDMLSLINKYEYTYSILDIKDRNPDEYYILELRKKTKFLSKFESYLIEKVK